MSDDDPTVHKIILSPVGAAHTPDSERIVADCGHECWIAQTGLAAVRNPFLRTETTCMRCVDPAILVEHVREHGGVFALPGAREELNRHLGVGEVDQMWSRFGIREHDPETDTN